MSASFAHDVSVDLKADVDIIRKFLDGLDPPVWGGPDLTREYAALARIESLHEALIRKLVGT